MEPDRVSDLIPFLHVADVHTSIAFYEKLGLTADDTHEEEGRLVWASLKSGSAALMLSEAEGPIHPSGSIFFLYTEDLAGLRDRLVADGWSLPEIVDGTPGPKYEMALCDPDRHLLTIAQVGE